MDLSDGVATCHCSGVATVVLTGVDESMVRVGIGEDKCGF